MSTPASERARAIVTALLDDDTPLAASLLDCMTMTEAEDVIIDLSTEVASLLTWMAEHVGDDARNIWSSVVLDRVCTEVTGGAD